MMQTDTERDRRLLREVIERNCVEGEAGREAVIANAAQFIDISALTEEAERWERSYTTVFVLSVHAGQHPTTAAGQAAAAAWLDGVVTGIRLEQARQREQS